MKISLKIIIILSIICVMMLQISQTPYAAFARRLNYQGRLTDSNGVPLASGNYDMVFSIYDASSGGNLVWTETHNSGTAQVTITNGLFSVVLGSWSSLNAVDFNGTEYWIQVAVSGTTYSPRQRLTATSNAINADLLDGNDSTFFQQRVAGQCGAGSSIRIINADGTVTCQTDQNTTDHGGLSGLGDDDHPQYFALAQNETVSGIPAFNGGTSGSSAPFSVDSTFLVTNLNADLLDGNHASAFMTAATDNWVNTTGDTMTGQLTNTYNSGSPFVITSTTVNTNLNADLHDGYHAGNASGNVPVSNGTLNTNLNADLLDGYNSPQLGNFGNWQTHGTYTDCNTDPSYWGWNYVQGTANCPNATSSQWYRGNFSLGSNYPMRGAGGYSMELAIPRYSPGSAGIWVRTVEGGAIGGWTRIDGSDPSAGAWTLSGNNLYPDSTAYNVAIGGTAPAVKLHVTGNSFFDLSGSSAVDKNLTIKTSGQGQINFGAYPGSWTPAIQLQNNDNTHLVWISPQDNGLNARFRTGASGLEFYTGGTTTDTGTFAGAFDTSGNLTVGADVRAGYGIRAGGTSDVTDGSIAATQWIGAGCEGNCESSGGYALLYPDGTSVQTSYNRATYFSDYNDTAYYMDPNGGSYLNDVYPRRIGPRYGSWSGIGDGGSAIINDNTGYNALMIVGSDQGMGYGRWVRIWDYLTVQGSQTVTGNLTVSGVLTRTCPSGFVARGTSLCVEDWDYSGYSMSACAGLCATRGNNGAHMCTSIDVRQAMNINTSIGNSWDNDYIGDQTADDQGLIVNSITNINMDGNDGNINDTDRWCRCCVRLE